MKYKILFLALLITGCGILPIEIGVDDVIILDGYNAGGVEFRDSFNRANGAPDNGWNVFNIGASDPTINSNVLRFELPIANTPTPASRANRYTKGTTTISNDPTIPRLFINTFDFNFVSYTLEPAILFSPDGVYGNTGQFEINKDSVSGNSTLVVYWAGGGSSSTTKTINDNTWYTCKTQLLNYGLVGGIYQADWKIKVWERGTAEPTWDIEVDSQPQGAIFNLFFMDIRLPDYGTTDPNVIVDIDNFYLYYED